MAVVKSFKAIRPAQEFASRVAALPYDVMNSEEAREMVKGNPYSFLHVDKAEIDLDPEIDLYDKKVYEKAQSNLKNMIKDKVLIQDETNCLYLYKLTMNGRSQTGLVACTSIDDYMNDIIKKHEHTRADKEQDRINHVDYCNSNTGPIFLTYRSKSEITNTINTWMKNNNPVYDFTAEDGVIHTVWIINNQDVVNTLESNFSKVETLYIADGHHRAASAVKVGLKRRDQNANWNGTEEFNFFLSVLFPDDELLIMDYNRVVQDLNGYSKESFLSKISEKFSVERYSEQTQYRPVEKHTFGMFLENEWYILRANEGSFNSKDPVDRLDVSILQNNLLKPILGIEDPRTDKRIDFVGGIRGLAELERRVNNGMKIAFSMHATTIDDLMSIADASKMMPPKSTWFEPKLRSGLFIHEL